MQSDWSIEGMGTMLMQEYDIYKDSSGWWQVDLELQQDMHPDMQEDHKQQHKKHLPSVSPSSLLQIVLHSRMSYTDKMLAAHARWQEQLLVHNIIEVWHCAGCQHQPAHGLSHHPAASTNKAPEPLAEAGTALVGAVLSEPEDAQATVQCYLKLDMSVGPLLRQFKGDEMELLLCFLLFLKQPKSQDLCKKKCKFSSYTLQDSKLCYVQDGKVYRVLLQKEAHSFAQAVHSWSHVGIAMTIKILQLQEGIT
ncbi:uncharacterized protein SPSC_01823 [Sporisorium scitamineum]|uniref:Uncharacterized protein n=1 Tax=Sporisorium scitamineum TaxID=49012 RepID=A0A127ZAU3_9BASI|nr:uncharacterized protein SPSC_01823 [Sporisorium scitamineum]